MPARPRTALVALLAALLTFLLATEVAGASLHSRLSKALRSSGVSWTNTGAFVTDLRTGEVVYARGRAKSLRPASNEKLVVALAALDELGARSQIPTRVLGMGTLDGNVWRGSLFLKGYGDPTLTSADLDRLARRVKAKGIRRITGSVLGDESTFDTMRTAPGWRSYFYKLECPPLSALIVDRGWKGTYTTSDPALSAAKEFKGALRVAGVRVPGKALVGVAPPETTTLARTVSWRIEDIVRRMNKESDNFYAEMLLKRLGRVVTGEKGTTARGAWAARRELRQRGIPVRGVRIVDGSGLSLWNRTTARTTVSLLRSALADEGIRTPFYASLARAGIDGTLEDRMESYPARDLVRAKTGTTIEASALSGYVGGTYAFSVLQNGNPVPWTPARKSQDRFAKILARRAS